MKKTSGSPVAVDWHRRIANSSERGMERERGGKIKCAPCALYRVIIFSPLLQRKRLGLQQSPTALFLRLCDLSFGVTQPKVNHLPLSVRAHASVNPPLLHFPHRSLFPSFHLSVADTLSQRDFQPIRNSVAKLGLNLSPWIRLDFWTFVQTAQQLSEDFPRFGSEKKTLPAFSFFSGFTTKQTTPDVLFEKSCSFLFLRP